MPASDGTFVRALLLALALACLSHPLHAAQSAPGAVPSTPTAGAAAAGASATPTLHDVVADLGRTRAMLRQLEATLRDTADWKVLASRLEDPALSSSLRALEEGRDTLSRARYMELIDVDTRIRERVRAVNEATDELGRLTRKVEENLAILDREAARWPERAKQAREREAPAEILHLAEAAGPEIAATRDRLRARRDQLLVAFGHGVALQTRLDAVRATVAERRERISAELGAIEDVPIWRQGAIAFPRDEVKANVALVRHDLADHLRQHGAWLGVLLGALTAFLFVALRQPPAAGMPRDALTPRSVGMALTGALLAGLALFAFLAPRGPFIFYRLIGFALPLLAGIVATRSFAATIPATAWTLVFAVFISEFRIFSEMSPGLARLMLAAQLLPFGVALMHDWRRGALARLMPGVPPVLLRRLIQAVLLMLVGAVVGSVLGRSGIARGLAALAVIGPGYWLIFAAIAWVLDQVFTGLLAMPLVRSLRSVRERGDAILQALHRLVLLFCWTAGVFVFMLTHSALDDLLRIANLVAKASVSAGEVTITFSAVFSALVVVVVTWLVTRVVRFALDHEILPRLDLRTGVPIAISTIVGYVLVVTGFVLAMAALGIDLTKVTLLAGAVGVGVGLGLQGVVNNFASGLILMLERPINVGDQIDVGGIGGEVRRIGVRSSTIRTSQGAEVIVPNADLASKQVTNWTLSDRARRYEIDVGVEYGSDPAQVLRLLESAAAEVPEVQKVPPPRALFSGFGVNSLDFRLFAWVESVDIGLQAQNGLRMAILRTLDGAGVAIPFPQRDLPIRYAPAGPEATAKRQT
jgi:small-conductance mechanosensitive channel